MSERNAARTGPGRISLPTNNWNDDSALITHTPSPNTPPNQEQNPFGDAPFNSEQWDSRHEGARAIYTGDEPPEIPDKVPIPVALPISAGAGVTPLPKLPMTVLSIMMLGEFLSANVSAPWVLFMVQSFDISEEESDVGYWTGVLCSMFFITQFATSLLWATVAEKHGRRT
ncbi:10346_t:CDS:2, partial [Acaulospora colombiana]